MWLTTSEPWLGGLFRSLDTRIPSANPVRRPDGWFACRVLPSSRGTEKGWKKPLPSRFFLTSTAHRRNLTRDGCDPPCPYQRQGLPPTGEHNLSLQRRKAQAFSHACSCSANRHSCPSELGRTGTLARPRSGVGAPGLQPWRKKKHRLGANPTRCTGASAGESSAWSPNQIGDVTGLSIGDQPGDQGAGRLTFSLIGADHQRRTELTCLGFRRQAHVHQVRRLGFGGRIELDLPAF